MSEHDEHNSYLNPVEDCIECQKERESRKRIRRCFGLGSSDQVLPPKPIKENE